MRIIYAVACAVVLSGCGKEKKADEAGLAEDEVEEKPKQLRTGKRSKRADSTAIGSLAINTVVHPDLAIAAPPKAETINPDVALKLVEAAKVAPVTDVTPADKNTYFDRCSVCQWAVKNKATAIGGTLLVAVLGVLAGSTQGQAVISSIPSTVSKSVTDTLGYLWGTATWSFYGITGVPSKLWNMLPAWASIWPGATLNVEEACKKLQEMYKDAAPGTKGAQILVDLSEAQTKGAVALVEFLRKVLNPASS